VDEVRIGVVDFSHRDLARWQRLQRVAGLHRCLCGQESWDYALDLVDNKLSLVTAGNRFKPLFVDFEGRRHSVNRKDLLNRALGRNCHVVLDATTGLGRDAAHMVSLGKQVVMVERHPVLFALLEDGMQRIECQRTADALRLLHGDTVDLLHRIEADAAYLDPMFETTSTSALPGREMQILRDLNSPDNDMQELFKKISARYRRTVVKRGDKAPALHPAVSHTVQGKAVRYDVYLNHSIGRSS